MYACFIGLGEIYNYNRYKYSLASLGHHLSFLSSDFSSFCSPCTYASAEYQVIGPHPSSSCHLPLVNIACPVLLFPSPTPVHSMRAWDRPPAYRSRSTLLLYICAYTKVLSHKAPTKLVFCDSLSYRCCKNKYQPLELNCNITISDATQLGWL